MKAFMQMDPTPLTLRPIGRDELPDLLALYAHLHVADEPLPAPHVVEAVWQQLLADPLSHYVGAYADGRLVASCVLTVVANLTRGCRPYGVVENVVTHADFRQRGCGKAVLQRALAIAWEQRCYKVMLMTGRKDEATLRFYEGAGFERGEKQALIAKPPAQSAQA